ncbi:MAG: tyrosine-type recombinase/integrase [Pirellulales bacterium]|nr:tyrosine-type recombinase/integrase [Pirellulales bacterium]
MPKLVSALPKYRQHKASGQAVVTLNGTDVYLGPWGSKVSRLEYDRVVSEWLQNGRCLPRVDVSAVTVTEVIAAYWTFASGYYVKHGKPTDELACIRVSLRFVRQLYGHTPASEFGPLALKTVRQKMIEAGHSRGYLNKNVSRVRRAFRWAVEQELVPTHVHHGLTAVTGLRRGRSEARETEPVKPAPEQDVEATLLMLPTVAADMVRLQRLSGCRPGEICLMRPCDLERTGAIWLYRPESHKCEHHDTERVIFLGPQAQVILRPYLLRGEAEYCFQPSRRRNLCYSVNAYRRQIHTAARKAGCQIWSPNQLRHSAATSVRERFGLEAAQVVLGHSRADVTQVYAERNQTLAAQVMAEIG